MSTKSTSHEYAQQMRKLADWLESRPEFEMPSYSQPYVYMHFYDKEPFLATVRALGAGKKEFTNDEIRFAIELPCGKVKAIAPRETVCRLIRPAEYDCEPCLSPEEEQAVGA